MNEGTFIGKSVAALTMLVVFLLPAVVQFSHIFEEDDHLICHEKTEHMHEVASDCPVCHFHLASFPYEISDYPDFILAVIPTTVEKKYTSLFKLFLQETANPLRAPPQLLG
ncbi:MAG: hypothetical protein WA913_12590 [Pricia sp.]